MDQGAGRAETPRTLLLIRHAKTEQYAAGGGGDRARALTPRGHRDAAALGEWLAARGLAPDLALVSTAVRARETWADVAAVLGGGIPVELADEVYGAYAEELLELVGGLDAARFEARPAGEHVNVRVGQVVAVVGHAPGMPAFAELLVGARDDPDGGHGDPQALDALRVHMPTSGVAVVQFEPLAVTTWADVAPGTGFLSAFAAPRG